MKNNSSLHNIVAITPFLKVTDPNPFKGNPDLVPGNLTNPRP
jgi:hypothetical protein